MSKVKTLRLKHGATKLRVKVGASDWDKCFTDIKGQISNKFSLSVNETCVIHVGDKEIYNGNDLKTACLGEAFTSKRIIDASIIEKKMNDKGLVVNVAVTNADCKMNDNLLVINVIGSDKNNAANQVMKRVCVTLGLNSTNTFFEKYVIISEDDDTIEEFEDLQEILGDLIDEEAQNATFTIKLIDGSTPHAGNTGVESGNDRAAGAEAKAEAKAEAGARSGSGSGGGRMKVNKKMFMFSFNGNVTSWQPPPPPPYDFNQLLKHLQKKFDVKEFNFQFPILFDVKHNNNKHLINNVQLNKIGNEMNENNFNQFCKLLFDTNNIVSMNFKIGIDYFDGCKSVIFSPQSQNIQRCVNYFVFKHNEINDSHENRSDVDDWDECFGRLIKFLKKVTNNDNDNDDQDDDISDVDYDSLPFAIHQIERETYKNKILEMGMVNDGVSGVLGLETAFSNEMNEIEDADDFQDCYDSDDSTNGKECYLFVENKHYFVLKNQGAATRSREAGGAGGAGTVERKDIEAFEWHPSKRDVDDDDWAFEYSNLIKLVCDRFGLIKNEQLELKFVENEGKNEFEDIDGADDIAAMWEELQQDNEKRKTILVNGIPMAANDSIATQNMKIKSTMHSITTKNKSTKNSIAIEQLNLEMEIEADMKVEITTEKERKDEDKKQDNRDNSAESLLKILLRNVLSRKNMESSFKKNNKSTNNNKKNTNEKVDLTCEALGLVFDKLLDKMKNEGHSEISSAYINVEKGKKFCVSHNNWEKGYLCLKDARNDIQPFDINEMLLLDSKTVEAAKLTKDQSIILVLGFTGSGKSTTCHFLAGSKMIIDKESGHIYPKPGFEARGTDGLKTDLKFTQSVTRYISAVPLECPDDMISNEIFYLCDAPGFDDSGGAEIDVANGLGIVKAVKEAKQVRILLVVGVGDMENRFQGIKKLANTLGEVLKDLEEDVESIDFVFTKIYDPHGNDPCTKLKNMFKKSLQELRENGERVEGPLQLIIDRVLEKGRKDQLIVLNPIKDDRIEVLRKLLNNRNCGWIEYPKDHFKEFIGDSSRKLIHQQISKHKEGILQCTKLHVNEIDFSLIDRKLNELNKLIKVLPEEKRIVTCRNECVEIVCKRWNDECDTAMKCIEDGIQHETSMKRFDSAVKKYKTIEEKLMKNNAFYQEYLTDKEYIGISPQLLVDGVKQHVKNLLSKCSIEHVKQNDEVVVKSNNKPDMEDEKVEKNEKEKDGISIEMNNNDENEQEKEHGQEMKQEQKEQAREKKKLQQHKFGNGEELIVNDKLGFYLGKAKILTHYFSTECKNDFNKQVEMLKKEQKKIVTRGIKMINDNEYGEFYDLLVNIMTVHQSLNDDLKLLFDLETKVNQLVNKMIDSLREQQHTLEKSFSIKLGFDPKQKNTMIKHKESYKNIKDAFMICGTENRVLGQFGKTLYQSCNEMYRLTRQVICQFCEVLIQTHIDQILRGKNSLHGSDSYATSSFGGSGSGSGSGSDENRSIMDEARMYVEFLISIREFDKDVQVDTCEIYHRLINQIVSHLECVRTTINQQLNAIENMNENYERESRNNNHNNNNNNYNHINIDYKELANSIAIIKDSDWVFDSLQSTNDKSKSKNDILRKVTKKMEEHIQLLLEETNMLTISLGNENCLIKMKHLMRRLQKMKCLEKLSIPTITNLMYKVVREIEEDVIRVMDAINTQFGNGNSKEDNKEDKKDDDDNVNQRHSPNKKQANEAMVFLKGCSFIQWVRIDDKYNNGNIKIPSNMAQIIKQCESSLTEYIGNYGEFIEKEIGNNLDCLCDLTSNAILTDEASTLSQLLKELWLIEKKYSELTVAFAQRDLNDSTKWIEIVKNRLEMFRSELLRLKNGKLPKLQVGLARVNTLSKIDWILKQENEQNDTFLGLYLEYQKQFSDHIGEKEIHQGIKNDDFFAIREAMSRLKQTMTTLKDTQDGSIAERVFESSKKLIYRKMYEIFSTTKVQVIKLKSSIDIGEVDDLRGYLTKINETKQYCMDYLDPKDQATLNKLEDTSKELLNQWMDRVLKIVSQLIEQKLFEDVEKQIESIQTMSALLGTLTEKIGQFEDLDKKIEKKCKEIEDTYKSITLKNANSNPYELFPANDLWDAITGVIKQRSCYRKLWDNVNKDLIQKFREELIQAKRSTLKQRTRILKLCESVVKSLPAKLKGILQAELSACRENISASYESDRKMLQEYAKDPDYHKLAGHWEDEYCNENVDTAANIESFVIDQISLQVNKIQACLGGEHTSEQGREIKKVHQQIKSKVQCFETRSKSENIGKLKHAKECELFMEQLSRKVSSVDNDIIRVFSTVCDDVSIEARTDEITKLEQTIDFLKCLQSLQMVTKNGQTMKEKLVQLKNKIEVYFDGLVTKFDDALGKDTKNRNAIDFAEIANILWTLKFYNGSSIFKLLDITKYGSNTYKEQADKVTKIFQSKHEYVMTHRLINSKTKENNKEKSEYFESILSIIKQFIYFNENQAKLFEDCLTIALINSI